MFYSVKISSFNDFKNDLYMQGLRTSHADNQNRVGRWFTIRAGSVEKLSEKLVCVCLCISVIIATHRILDDW
jgi:hypothetical protein